MKSFYQNLIFIALLAAAFVCKKSSEEAAAPQPQAKQAQFAAK